MYVGIDIVHGNLMGLQQLQHYTQDMSRIPLKYNTNVLFYRKYTHPTLICRGTDARSDRQMDARTDAWMDRQKIFTQYSGISPCS